MSSIPAILKKDQTAPSPWKLQEDGMRKGEICLLLAGPSSGKTNFFSTMNELKLKETK